MICFSTSSFRSFLAILSMIPKRVEYILLVIFFIIVTMIYIITSYAPLSVKKTPVIVHNL